jgi:hypothetical protein
MAVSIASRQMRNERGEASLSLERYTHRRSLKRRSGDRFQGKWMRGKNMFIITHFVLAFSAPGWHDRIYIMV